MKRWDNRLSSNPSEKHGEHHEEVLLRPFDLTQRTKETALPLA